MSCLSFWCPLRLQAISISSINQLCDMIHVCGTGFKDMGKSSGKKVVVRIQHVGPCVLPWLWQSVAHGDDVVLIPQPIELLAGPEGLPLCFAFCQS